MNYLDNPGNRLVRQTLSLSRENLGYTSTRRYPEQLHPAVNAASIAGNVNFVLLHAELSRQFADSYRDFRVGAAAMAVFRREQQLRMAYVHGANAKPVAGSDIINVHAEHTVLSMVEDARRPGESTYHIPLIAIIGDLQPDQQSGTNTSTLHPCGICRDMFYEDTSPIDDKSLIVTAASDFRVVEWCNRKALRALHETGDDSGIGRVEFVERHPLLTLPDWYREAAKTGAPVVLADHDNEYEAEADYNERVRDPIFRYVVQMHQ